MNYVYQTPTGQEVTYTDSKRYFWLLALSSTYVLAASVWAYTQTPSAWILELPLIYFYIGIPFLDFIFGEDLHNPPPEVLQQMEKDPFYTRLLLLSSVGFAFNLLSCGYLILNYELSWLGYLLLTLSSAAISGGVGLTISHELGHRGTKLEQFAAQFINAFSIYGHFTIEHNRGHHVHVSTPEDCASSRFNENLYQFAMREQFGALKRGWQHELTRLKHRQLPALSWQNQILRSYAMTLAIWMVMVVLFGWLCLPFLLLQSYLAQWYLTLANYIEHYGIGRKRLDNGRYVKCMPEHSWNTNHKASNLLTFHLQRHSDHHAYPTRPYQVLRNFEHLPRLPSGYPGCFLLAIVPAVWFKVMNPRVIKWVESSENTVLNRA